MMIKINLLPTKRKTPKKVTELQQQMILGVLILIIVGIGIGYLWVALNNRIAELQRDKAAAEARIREQDNMLREVKNVEDERKKVMDKIDIIEQLKKNQVGPATWASTETPSRTTTWSDSWTTSRPRRSWPTCSSSKPGRRPRRGSSSTNTSSSSGIRGCDGRCYHG
jgi:hypothetical protein